MTSVCANRTLLHTTPALLSYGGESTHFILQLCNAICRINEAVRLAILSRDSAPISALSDIQIFKAGLQRRFDLELQSIHAKTPLSLVHQHGIWQPTMREAAAFTRKKRIPRVVSIHGMLHPNLLKQRPLQKKIDLFLYQRRDLKEAAALHATSPAEVEQIRAQGLRNPVILLPVGIPLPQIEAQAIHLEEKNLRSVLCMAPSLQPQELKALLHAWAKLRPQGWRLRIAGSDNAALCAELQKLAVELKIDGSVEISGVLFGLAHQHAYRSADLFILPTRDKANASVGFEALGYGLPLLTFAGTIAENLEQAGCGWQTADADALNLALQQAMALSPAERAAAGKAARNLIERKYHWPAIAADMLLSYSWLLGETSTAPDCILKD